MAGSIRALSAALVMAAVAVLIGPVAPARAAEGPPRILLYGDSTVQGISADWTWRYRLWQSLTQDGGSVDLVGPRQDLVRYNPWALGNQEYRNPDFDTDHAGLSSMTLTSPSIVLSDTVGQYTPDVVVGLIGINDLKRKVATPAQLVDTWRAEIARSRELVPGVDVVMVQLPQTWYADVPVYNAGLVALAAELDQPEARVITVAAEPFRPYADTFDTVHFTDTGERKIATAVADGLASIGVGTGAHTVADPPSSTVWAPTPKATVSGRMMLLTWNAVDYASSEDIWWYDVSNGTSGIVQRVQGTAMWMPGQYGHLYALRLAPVKGYREIGTSSPWLWVKVPVAA
jgi:lysophospholipase L1-like esterase